MDTMLISKRDEGMGISRLYIFYKTKIAHIAHETLESIVAADTICTPVSVIQIDAAEILFEPGYLGESSIGNAPVRHHGE